MIKNIFLFISILTFSFNVNAENTESPTNNKKEVITVIADTWCPYNCNPKSPHPGFMIDIVKQAFAKHNIDVEYTTMPWTRAIEETRKGMHTAIIGASTEDAPDFIFPTTNQGLMINNLYVKNGNPWRYSGVNSLKKIVFGAIDGYSYNDEIDSYIKKYKLNPTYIEMMSGNDALAINVSKLIRGKIGVTIESKYVMDYYLSQNNLKDKIVDIASLPPSSRDGLYIAFTPKNKKISQKYANIISEETKNMRASGELKKIMDNYGLSDWEIDYKK
ncbi:MAG: transporter substrate-binding domain-containing protein [Pseudomonadota bacterium]